MRYSDIIVFYLCCLMPGRFCMVVWSWRTFMSSK